MSKHKTIYDKEVELVKDDFIFNYQKDLTDKLDSNHNDYDQNLLNEIILWKVNRYAKLGSVLTDLINRISPLDQKINVDLTKEIIRKLLRTKGIQLPMASTILRFKNPTIYQIIDQRVYRIIYEGRVLKLSQSNSDKKIEEKTELYLNYLEDLKQACDKLKIPFTTADRVLYQADKRINKDIKLNNY